MRRFLTSAGGPLTDSEKLLVRCLDQLDRIDMILDAPIDATRANPLAAELLSRTKRVLGVPTE